MLYSRTQINDTELLKKYDHTYIWSTNCGYCIKEMPILRNYVQQGSIKAICVARNPSDSANAAGIAISKAFKSEIVIDKKIV